MEKTTQKKQPKKGKSLSDFGNVKGMHDILPKDAEWWRAVWDTGKMLSDLYDFHYIETPVLEHAELFIRGNGASDGIEKKLFMLKTRDGEQVALRADLSAPVMRSYIQNHLGYFASPLKIYQNASIFRFEKIDDGKLRQIHQWGFDVIGDNDPVYDMQIILAAFEFLKILKFQNLRLRINTAGCKVCRTSYREKLKTYYRKQPMCATCKTDLEENPMRLFNCAKTECRESRKEAPIILDHLCQGCNNHFKAVLELVEDNSIVYEPDPFFVREKEYCNRTIFEIISSDTHFALAGGGRYDYLAEALFGKTIPGVGVALGLDRIVEQLRIKNVELRRKMKPRVAFMAVGDQARKMSVRLMNMLRMGGVGVVEAIGKKTLKAQMKFAEKSHVPIALIFGQKEAFENSIIVRDMKSGAQETFIVDTFVEQVKKRLK
ncbi:MAG: histidine--tRNA ligase [Candidatus Paceibacterota bacterium]|jgi:histidyl-tRNA synthetase